MHALLKAIFYTPLYNGLIFFIGIIPFHNVGVAVILFTLIIKLVLFPLSQKSVKTQFEMKKLEPELNEMKLKYKDNKALQAEKTIQLYKDRGINPFSGILLMFIQLPVLLALYYLFRSGGLPNINHVMLYPFIAVPSAINITFFGTSVMAKSVVFAILAGLAQFLQMQFMLPKAQKRDEKSKAKPEFKDELARSMNMQMKYVMPFVVFFIAKSFPIVVSLYLITSSLFAVGQELYVRRKNKSVAA